VCLQRYRQASRAVNLLYELALALAGLKPSQFMMLNAIAEVGEIAQCEFARRNSFSRDPLAAFCSFEEKRVLCLPGHPGGLGKVTDKWPETNARDYTSDEYSATQYGGLKQSRHRGVA
jgi:hypothetical protein